MPTPTTLRQPLALCASALIFFAAPGCEHGHGDDGHSHDSDSHADETGGHAPALPTNADCPDGSAITYADFAESFFAANCNACHSEGLTGDARSGAPEGVDFDTLELIGMHTATIDSHAAAHGEVVNEIMPPEAAGLSVSLADRESLAEWIACGTP